MFLFNAFGVAHGGVAAVLHRSVAADMAYSMVGCILDSPVLADMGDGLVTGVSYLLGVKASSKKEG